MKILPICWFLLFVPFSLFAQGDFSSKDQVAVQNQIRHFTTLHSLGIGLSVGGAACGVGGALIILPTTGENGSHSVADRTLGLSLVVGGLAVMMSGIIMVGQSGARLQVLRSEIPGLSIGISPEPNAPGVVITYRL